MKTQVALLVAASALSLGVAAYAQQPAFTSKSVHLRAGPARDYPVVAVLAPYTRIEVFACLPGYTWCDVAAGYDRGWVYAGNVTYTYEGREVLLPGIATVIGIGITAFIIDEYWHDHYIDRPWWPQRQRWYRPAPLPPIRARQPAPHPQAEPGPGYRPPRVQGSPQQPQVRPPQPPQVRPPQQPLQHPQQRPQRPQQQPRERPRDQGE